MLWKAVERETRWVEGEGECGSKGGETEFCGGVFWDPWPSRRIKWLCRRSRLPARSRSTLAHQAR
jgi:hypothetical protein